MHRSSPARSRPLRRAALSALAALAVCLAFSAPGLADGVIPGPPLENSRDAWFGVACPAQASPSWNRAGFATVLLALALVGKRRRI